MEGSANLHWTNSAQKSDSTSEKRRHPRFHLNLPIEFRVMDASSVHGAMIVNASETGLLIQSPHNMAVGTKLNIAVLFSKGFELANFKVSAEVVWTKAYSDEGRKGYELGLRFTNILRQTVRNSSIFLVTANKDSRANLRVFHHYHQSTGSYQSNGAPNILEMTRYYLSYLSPFLKNPSQVIWLKIGL